MLADLGSSLTGIGTLLSGLASLLAWIAARRSRRAEIHAAAGRSIAADVKTEVAETKAIAEDNSTKLGAHLDRVEESYQRMIAGQEQGRQVGSALVDVLEKIRGERS